MEYTVYRLLRLFLTWRMQPVSPDDSGDSYSKQTSDSYNDRGHDKEDRHNVKH